MRSTSIGFLKAHMEKLSSMCDPEKISLVMALHESNLGLYDDMLDALRSGKRS